MNQTNKTSIDKTINTPRFTLKELTSKDASLKYLAWLNTSQSVEFITHCLSARAELAQYIDKNFQDPNCYFWGIYHQGVHIGNVKYERLGANHKVATMGILIGDKNWQGKGVAGEVIVASAHYLKQNFGFELINLGVAKRNTAAVTAYQHIGFEVTEDGYFDFDDTGWEMIWKID